MVNWFKIITLGLIVGVLSAIFDWPFWLSAGLIVTIGLCSIANMFYIVYVSTNMQRVKKYIENHQKDPLMRYLLKVEKGTNEEVLSAMNEIIAHYKQPSIKNAFEMNRALLMEEYEQANYFADQLKNVQLKTYGKALVAAVQGKEAQLTEFYIKSEWMQYALVAELAIAQRNQQRFEEAAVKAIHASRGIQRFSLIHSFKRSKRKLGWGEE